ncbi:MAG TPA: CpsD/CapB family tyrosine-protein kinase [Kofleriaceae bacterium]|nr:CpsD/CapB family tyrosine-protein kinase [Kofleriaceae bacterium]
MGTGRVRTTVPMPTTVESNQGALGGPTAPMDAAPSISISDAVDEPTRAMAGTEGLPYGKNRFVPPDDPNVRTTISSAPARDRAAPATTPARAAVAAANPPRPSVTQRDMAAPSVTMPMPAVARDLPAVTEPAAPPAADPPTSEIQKSKIWVATHKLPVDPDPRLILVRDPDSARAASFRVLRHRLQERGDPRTIAVTSAEQGEGKTTCAVNLALALGECGRARVLLVEANLRAPSLAALFGFLPPECFAAQLTKHRERPLEPWSVVEVFAPSLHVAAVKPGPENENRPLLDGVAFGIAMDMLKRSGYDYIVVDTPPILGSADVNLVEDFTDGVVITTWSRKSSARALRTAVEQLAPAKLLGITLLDV